VHDEDVAAELDMVHTQARLLVANFLKNGYHVVLEGAFYYERDGALHRHEQEIDQTLALMRNIAASPLVVRLMVSPDSLRRRIADAALTLEDGTAARIDASYKPRYGGRFLSLSTDESPVEELAARVLERLWLE
jgi:hypothetical protein